MILADNEWTIIKAEDIEFQPDTLSTELKTYGQVDEEKHWQDVREHAAIAALNGMLADYTCDGSMELMVKGAISFADELVKILKNGETEISK